MNLFWSFDYVLMIPCSDSLQCVKSTYRLTKSLFFHNNPLPLNKPSSVNDDDDEEDSPRNTSAPSPHSTWTAAVLLKVSHESNCSAFARLPADSVSLDNSPTTPKLKPHFYILAHSLI